MKRKRVATMAKRLAVFSMLSTLYPLGLPAGAADVNSLLASVSSISDVDARQASIEKRLQDAYNAGRLTQAQYKNTIHDVFGDDIVIAGGLEPDVVIGDFASVGASETSISPRGVEQYESLAFDIAQQALT
ncbi:MAG TPA: DUF1587 domain-containing protein, partial [Candidatus Obscuribacter sp.]|nr:DUF1587 domain-containing protein [Candidatus Obscuribacter sp.]